MGYYAYPWTSLIVYCQMWDVAANRDFFIQLTLIFHRAWGCRWLARGPRSGAKFSFGM